MKFRVRPEIETEKIVLPHYKRRSLIEWLLNRKREPVSYTVLAGRSTITPAVVDEWPYPLGQKIDRVCIEDLMCYGVFLYKIEGQEFTLWIDHMRKEQQC